MVLERLDTLVVILPKIVMSPPPEPVLLIDSPPGFSDVLPGTGEGAFDFETPTFRICART